MKVRATQTGYNGWKKIKVGEVFEIDNDLMKFSPEWMEEVSPKSTPAPTVESTPKQDEEVRTPEPKAAPSKKGGRSKKDVI